MAVGTQAGDMRGLEDDELLSKLREAKEELFNLRFQSATGQLESHGRLKAVRKEIARIYTIMRERELGIGSVESTDSVDSVHSASAASAASADSADAAAGAGA
jgi:large subunit ribosomal protein L29